MGGINDWIEIFRTGNHVDMSGAERYYGSDDLDWIISSYNPQNHEAPVVIGHPEHDSPAFGWVEALRREGEILYAKLKQVVPEFVEMVKNGLYKKRSIALYPNGKLRHVGFLGAVPPAIKGLADVRFQERAKTIFCFSDIEWKEVMEMGSPKKLRVERARDIGHKLVFLAEEKMGVNKDMTYSEAMAQIQKENPELVMELVPKEEDGRPGESPRMRKARALGLKIASLTGKKMKANKGMTYSEAMMQVQKENPEIILEFLRME